MNTQIDPAAGVPQVKPVSDHGHDGNPHLASRQRGGSAGAHTASHAYSNQTTQNGAPANGGAEATAPNDQDMQASLKQINEHLASVHRQLRLNVDASTGLTVATVLDSGTGVVLQQYPTQNTLQLAQMLASWSHGGNVLLDLIA